MKQRFLTGVMVLLPLLITFHILAFLLNLLTGPFEDMATSLLSHLRLLQEGSEQALLYTSRLLILVLIALTILLAGLLGEGFVVRHFMRYSEALLRRIPLVNKIHSASRETITGIFNPKARTFQRAVLVPFPNSAGLCVGFMTQDSLTDRSDPAYQQLVPVLLPATPNPTVGFVLLYKPEAIVPLAISLDEALRFVVSCGVIAPQTHTEIDHVHPN